MSRPTRFLLSLPAALVILFLASCALPAVKPTTLIPPFIDAEEAVAALTDSGSTINDIRGTVTLQTFDENGTSINSVTGYMAFRYPDRVRFTYIGPFGIVLFEALVNETTTILFLPQQLTAYKGKTDTIEGGPFSPKLMGIPFRKPAGPIFVIEHDGPESILYSISSQADRYSLVEKIIFDRLTMRPTIREDYENGRARYRITYLTYEVVEGISVPTDIALEDLASGTRMAITMRDCKVNTGITDEVFDTTVQPPYVEKPLDSFVLPDY
jgi:outer membrane lipoprotein-sorting protein